MKRKALKKTIYDIFMIIILFIISSIIGGTVFYLFLNIPYWVLGKSNDYPEWLIYSVELAIIAVVIWVGRGIRALYLRNLEEISSKENNQ